MLTATNPEPPATIRQHAHCAAVVGLMVGLTTTLPPVPAEGCAVAVAQRHRHPLRSRLRSASWALRIRIRSDCAQWSGAVDGGLRTRPGRAQPGLPPLPSGSRRGPDTRGVMVGGPVGVCGFPQGQQVHVLTWEFDHVPWQKGCGERRGSPDGRRRRTGDNEEARPPLALGPVHRDRGWPRRSGRCGHVRPDHRRGHPRDMPSTVRSAAAAGDPAGYAQPFVESWLRSSANDTNSAQARLAQSLAPNVDLPDPVAGAQQVPASVTPVRRQTAFEDPNRFTAVVLDELYWLTWSTEGTALVHEILQDGRKHGSGLIAGSHDAEELGPDRGLMAYRAPARTADRERARRGLDFLGLDPGDPELLRLVTTGSVPRGTTRPRGRVPPRVPAAELRPGQGRHPPSSGSPPPSPPHPDAAPTHRDPSPSPSACSSWCLGRACRRPGGRAPGRPSTARALRRPQTKW